VKYTRVILIVLDGFGVGILPDEFNNAQNESSFEDVLDIAGMPVIPTLASFGMFNLTKKYITRDMNYNASYGKMKLSSKFKDSWAGHWELAGCEIDYTKVDSSYWINGFPEPIIRLFEKQTGYIVLGNRAFLRREDVIPHYIDDHNKMKKSVIVLTEEGIESVRTFGLYALLDNVPVDILYDLCEKASELLRPYNKIIGRIGARPLRYNNDRAITVPHELRKDYLIFDPPDSTILKQLKLNNINSYTVGKVSAMFRGTYIKDSIQTSSNKQSMDGISNFCTKVDHGLIWGNLNDFDAKYGHYYDYMGWKKSLENFDIELTKLISCIRNDDLLIICSDGHGCDCIYTGIHTREFSPLIIYSKEIECAYLGEDNILNDVAATIASSFCITFDCSGKSLLTKI